MKKLTLLLLAVFTFAFANAQSNSEEIDLMQSIFGMEKKAMVSEFVKVDPAQSVAFWAIYDEYEMARKELGKKRLELFDQYVSNYENMTYETADKWTAEVISLSKSTDKLLTTYYKKVKKATTPVVALQFYQLEGYILSAIRVSVLEALPIPQVR